MTLSVVIPTCNRAKSLHRLLASLSLQTRPPEEIIIVDASDVRPDEAALQGTFPGLPIRCIPSAPSVCSQRNRGIREAGTTHIMLCDDDMELPSTYIEHICTWYSGRPTECAVTGVVMEPEISGAWTDRLAPPSAARLFWNWLFQLSVWGDTDTVQAPLLSGVLFHPIKRWYRNRGNTLSLAGWPLVTQVSGNVFRSRIYGLGAAVIRRQVLLGAPYEERLDPRGIGDNYGVALQFPPQNGIVVLRDNPVFHYKEQEQRPSEIDTMTKRLFALHFFLRRNPTHRVARSGMFLWSLAGYALQFVFTGSRKSFIRSSIVFLRVLLNKNPYDA